MISYVTGRVPAVDALRALYDSVGWTLYSKDAERTHRAVGNCSLVVTAWDGADLVGLARVLSDDVSICYLQDVIVHPDHQRSGVGRELVQRVLAPYADVRQTVLLSDDETRQQAFYTALGFERVGTGELGALRAFARFAQ